MSNLTKALVRWKEVILLTTLLKVSLFILSMIFDSNINTFFSRWIRWDGPHYIDIAQHWYQTQGQEALFIVFYPLYPILIKIVSVLTQNFPASAIIVSTFFSFIASIALYELTLLDFNKRTAILSVWFLNIFPLAYFLQASYTESLFLSLSILCLYFFRKEKFKLAGFLGALSTITRINGLLLYPTLLIETKKSVKSIITLTLLPLGFFLYLIINKLIYGDFFYFQQPLYNNWYKKFSFPWFGINNLISSVKNFHDPNFYVYFSELVAIIFITFFTVFVFFKVRKSYGIYMLVNLLLITSTNYILSTPRYAVILFPIYIALAQIKNRFMLTVISTIFLSLLFYLTYIFTQGKWAY